MRVLHPRAADVALALLIGVFALRLLDVAATKSLTIDEPHYVGKGLYLWQTGDYAGFDTLLMQPPLAYHLASLPWLLLDRDGLAIERHAGLAFVEGATPDTPLKRIRLLSRAPFVAVACLGVVLVFLWARELAGPGAGLVAALLATHHPALAAYAPLAHSDTMLAVLFLQTLYTFWRWWRAPSPLRAALCGVSLGLCFAAKMSTVLLAASLPLVALSFTLWPRPPQDAPEPPAPRQTLAALVVIGVAALLTLTLAYGGSLRFAWQALGPVSLPLPEYARVMLFMGGVARDPRPFWFLGELTLDPGWYFLPVAALMKTPIPFFLLLGAACWRRGPADPRRARLGLFLGVPCGLYLLAALFVLRVPQGVRFLLPLLLPLCIVIGARSAGPRSHREKALLAVGCCWLVGTAVWTHPHYIPYFNAAVGGPGRAMDYFADSNVDWGQDVSTLATWLHARGNPPVHVALFSAEPPQAYGLDARPLVGCRPPREGGLLAISAAVLRGMFRPDNYFARPPAGCYDWLAGLEPVAAPGQSIRVYDLGAPRARPRQASTGLEERL